MREVEYIIIQNVFWAYIRTKKGKKRRIWGTKKIISSVALLDTYLNM